MTARLPLDPARGTLCLVALLLTGCATVAPMQTASVVEDGHWRVGGQLGAAAYCGSFTGGPLECTEYPDGAPLPELRVDARRGLPGRVDVGMSLQLYGQILAPSRPIQAGLTLEAKHALIDVGPHVLSLGILLGGAVAGRPKLPLLTQVEGAVELFYGYRTARFEWVAGALLTERIGAARHINVTLGVFKRNGWALQLGYLGDFRHVTDGAIQLQYGVFWDLSSGSSAGR